MEQAGHMEPAGEEIGEECCGAMDEPGVLVRPDGSGAWRGQQVPGRPARQQRKVTGDTDRRRRMPHLHRDRSQG